MLFKQHILEGIAAGRVTLAFRRWKRPTVRSGSMLRTAVGVVAIDEVTEVDAAAISDREAAEAGHASREALMQTLAAQDGQPVLRIALRFAGEDPRAALRDDDRLSDDDADQVAAQLARLDRASRRGPWTETTLRLIHRRPKVRAAELAEELGRDNPSFKRDIRKLKELGLTESLDIGYRLSPRGEALINIPASGKRQAG